MTDNKIKLDKSVAQKLIELASNIRKAGVELALFAAEIRDQHIDEKGNYDKEFVKFWNTYELDSKFGTRSNFTKYALAGSGYNKVKANLEKFEPKLPTSISALYELSQLTLDEMDLCFETTFSRSEITSDRSKWKKPNKPKPLITPSTTASTIKAWRENWRNPKPKSSDKRRLPLATIMVHGSLYDFDKSTGNHIGIIDKDKINEISLAVKEALKPFSNEIYRVDFEDQKLLSGFDTRSENILNKINEKQERIREIEETKKSIEENKIKLEELKKKKPKKNS